MDEARGVSRPGDRADVVVGGEAGEGEARVLEEEGETLAPEHDDKGDGGEEELGENDEGEPDEERNPEGVEEPCDVSAVVVL